MTATIAPPAPARAAAPARRRTLAGTAILVRFILRRDRVRLPVWIGTISLFVVAFAATLPEYYADAAERQSRADLMGNPGLRAFSGPGFGLDDYTFGAMIAQEFLTWTGIFVALMSFLLVVRHTRAEEESQRAELVRASTVGRHAPTAAALAVVGGANILLGVLIALGLGSLDLGGVTWAGSWLFGAALASIGLVFAAVGALTAQLNQTARGAGGMAGAAFAAAYLVRAAGDMAREGGSALSWLSPIGWAQQTRVYVDDRWWPLLLSLALAAVVAAAAFRLGAWRDVGTGLLQPRPGTATAAPRLSSPLGLAWRLHRASVAWWGGALLAFALAYGSLAGEVERFAEDLSTIEEWLAEVGGATLLDSFLAVVILMWALGVAVFAVQTALRLRSEETAGRAEPVLATAVSHERWVGSHLAVALGGTVVLLALSGLGFGLTASAAADDWGLLPRLVGAALAYAPAIWLTVGIAVALFGLLPRATALAWIVIAYAGVIGMFADLFGFPDWTVDLSPFGHVPMLPAVAMDWTPLMGLTAIAAGLVAAGLYGFRQRDVETR